MLLKSLHYSGGGAQSITLPSSLSASHPATQHIDHPVAQQNVMDTSQCSDLPADDDIDDTNTSSGQRIFSCDYHIIFSADEADLFLGVVTFIGLVEIRVQICLILIPL